MMTWLARVQQLYRQRGLTVRQISVESGISHTYVSNILNAKSVPSLPMLQTLLTVLTPNRALGEAILTQFMREVPDFHEVSTQRKHGASSADLRALTDAINNLADAIRSLGT